MIKVIQIIDDLGIGGAEKLQLFFAQKSRAYDIDVTQVSFGADKKEPLTADFAAIGVPVFYFPARSLLSVIRLFKLTFFYKKINPDIIQTHMSYQNIIGSIAARLVRKPVVCTLHSANIHDEFYNPIRFWMEKVCLKHLADAVIAVGKTVKDAYQPHLKSKEILVIPNPVNVDFMASTQPNFELKRTLFKEDCVLTIAIGRLVPAKGFQDLIDAFSEVVKLCPDARLIIIGDGGLRIELESQINKLGLNEVIKLLLTQKDVHQYLLASDIFVNASHWEGLPISLLEGMAAGLPVIATRVGDIPYIVNDETGILVPPQNSQKLAAAIVELIHYPNRRKNMGQSGQNYIREHHSIESWMGELSNLFKQTIQEYAL